jgi:tRNA-dihydrouridine synthase B
LRLGAGLMDHAMPHIGPFRLAGRALLAPMAGVTDLPFRRLCRRMGAALAPSEMLSADKRLWETDLSRRRRDHTDEPSPRVVQIAGGDPVTMAEAARRNVDAGAEIIDINMGCPAKKVCNRDAGSALLRDEPLVASILASVVAAVSVPVTLKIRTGWDPGDTQRRARRATRSGRRRAGIGRAWPHAGLSLRRRRGVRHRCGDQTSCCDPGVCKR